MASTSVALAFNNPNLSIHASITTPAYLSPGWSSVDFESFTGVPTQGDQKDSERPDLDTRKEHSSEGMPN
jgi:hypothetical protein